LQVALDQSNSDLSLDTLTNACENSIGDCQLILEQIIDGMYTYRVENHSSVGAHIRHIIERFNCFFDGHPQQLIDYDNRKRDRNLEASLVNAKHALAGVSSSLNKVRASKLTAVSVSESVDDNHPPVVVQSTIERELMGLVSHTTHQLAIIVMLVNAQGGSLPVELGKAPSTLIFENRQ
jgi:hypothetical protein